jgi:lipid-A-disaccharide synthase
LKYYIIAGEASGDLHASNLIKQLKRIDPHAQVRGWGGDLMMAQGTEIVRHYRDLAFMGFIEVAVNLPTILKNIDWCKNDLMQYHPDAVILVDYPGFNLRIAKFAHEIGLKVFYYISPQVWAWKESRVEKIKKSVNRMFVILPFEKEFYKRFDYEVSFVGHPLLDVIEENKSNNFREIWLHKNRLPDKPVVALLPGSRKQEISTMLPIMMELINDFKEFQFIIGAAPSVPPELYQKLINRKKIKIVYNDTYNLLRCSDAALVTSGTATLETALFDVPEVVCYKGNFASYHLARHLVQVKYISLVNLIMDKPVLKELIQSDLNKGYLQEELTKMLYDSSYRNEMKKHYKELKEKLGGSGAAEKTAKEIYKMIK